MWVCDTSKGREREIRARSAVVAAPAYAARSMIHDLPADTAAALEVIPYGPYVVGAVLTDEKTSMPWDDIYALATPKRSFSMLFNTANVLRRPGEPRKPGGSLFVYAAAGFARRLAGLDDATVMGRFRADLEDLYPELRDIIQEIVIQRWERGLPFPRPGRSRLQPALTRLPARPDLSRRRLPWHLVYRDRGADGRRRRNRDSPTARELGPGPRGEASFAKRRR